MSSALVGSCTNSSYEDITRAASIARQASAKGLRAKTQLLITPGSEQVRATIERDGLLADLEAIGGTVLANACGPVHRPVGSHRPRPVEGQHDRQQLQPQLPEAQRRQRQHEGVRHVARHGHRATRSPARSTSTRSPTTSRRRAGLDPPVGEDLPAEASTPASPASSRRPTTRRTSTSSSTPDSERLQLLEPFPAWDGKDYIDLPVLMKAKGKCTTDHISAAGKWLTLPRPPREHLAATCSSASINAFTGATGEGKDPLDGATRSFPDIAKHLGEAGHALVCRRRRELRRGLVTRARGDGAALPRRRWSIFARSFARIHETNLKKQGMLPLTFADPATYDQIGEDDRISVLGLAELAPDTAGAVPHHEARRLDDRLRDRAHVQPGADRVVPSRQRAQHHPGQADGMTVDELIELLASCEDFFDSLGRGRRPDSDPRALVAVRRAACGGRTG